MWRWINFFSFCAMLSASVAELQAFEPLDRWNFTATNGFTGAMGTPVTLTWSLADDGTLIPDGSLVSSDLIQMLDFEFGAGPGGADYSQRPWFSIFTDSFDRLGELAGLDYVYQSNDDGANFSTGNSGSLGVRGDMRIGGRTYGAGSTTLGSNFFPDYGEMMINTDKGSSFDNSQNNFRLFRNTLMHEALHGVGINHVDAASPSFLMEPAISTLFDGPQLDDLLAMQRQYGDVYEKSGGNNVFSSATPLGLVSASSTAMIGQNGSSTLVFDTQTDFVSIDNNSDIDFHSFTLNSSEDIAINLRPQGASYLTGPEGGTVATLDTRLLSDLTLTLLNTNGISVLGTSNASAAGGAESLMMSLGAGTYFARVTGSQNNIQLYELSVAVAGDPENLTWTGQASNVWDLQTTANFNNGGGADTFANGDTVTFDDSGQEKTVSLAGSLSPAATIINASSDYTFTGHGALTGGSSLTKDGSGTLELDNSGNNYTGVTQVNAGTLIFSGDTSAMVSTITVAGGGTLVMDSSLAGGNGSSFVINPGGTLQVGRQASNADVFPNSPVSVINNGVIRVLDFESVTNISGTGDVIAVAEMALLANNSYSGQTIVEAGGSIQPTDNTAFGSTVGNTVVEAGGFIIAQNDTLGPASLVLGESFVFAGNGNGGGALQVALNTSATFQGNWTLSPGGGKIGVTGDSSAVMSGTVGAVAGLAILDVSANSTLELGGDVLLGTAGLAKISPGPVTFSSAVNLSGPIDIQAGSVEFSSSGSSINAMVRVASGASLQLTSNPAWGAASALTGNGTVQGNLTMPGSIAPGDSTAGTLLVDGNFTFTGSSDLVIEIGGVLPGQFDLLDIDGSAVLDGTLSVALVNLGGGLFQPQLGNSFGFLDALFSTSGAFDSLMLPSLSSGLGWQLSSVGTTTFLSVVSSFAADFDNDGDVDGADLLQWQSDFGGLGSDANGSGISDGADFLIWQRQFSGGVLAGASTAAVPEPTSLMLMLAALASMMPFWRFDFRMSFAARFSPMRTASA